MPRLLLTDFGPFLTHASTLTTESSAADMEGVQSFTGKVGWNNKRNTPTRLDVQEPYLVRDARWSSDFSRRRRMYAVILGLEAYR